MLSKVTDNKRAISVLYTKHRHVSRLCQIFRRAHTHTPAEMDEYVYDHSVQFRTLLVEILLLLHHMARITLLKGDDLVWQCGWKQLTPTTKLIQGEKS